MRLCCVLWSLAMLFGASLHAQAPVTGRLLAEARITDPATASLPLSYGDARGFRAKAVRDRIECVLEMAKPLIEGMFTCVHLSIDCDDNPASGIDGRELRIRAAVGSRFQPNSVAPTNGSRRAIDHLRISCTELQPDGNGGKHWIHMWVQAEPPVVHGNELRFWFPRSLVRERGDRYHGRIAMQVRVETSCSDQPIERMHICSDEGMPIKIDGRSEDWSAVAVPDPAGELHATASCIDMTSLRVDHGPDCLFVGVELMQSGFSTWPCDVDVVGRPGITFLIDPQFPRYQDPYEVSVWGASLGVEGWHGAGSWQCAGGDRFVEVRLPRKQGQNRLRVIVVSDLKLQDLFGVELRIDTEAL